MIIATHLPVVKGRPPSWAWRIDPDWSALAARAVTAPAWAGPKGMPCFGRPTLDCRCTTCRAGRPYLRYSLHLLQGALAVEPAYPLADGAPGLLQGLALPGILWFIGEEATEVFACGADEEFSLCPGALAQEASGAPLRQALRAVEGPCRSQRRGLWEVSSMWWRLQRAAGDLGNQSVNHAPHLAQECLTGILIAGHAGELLFPLSRELRRREQRSVEGSDQRQALWGRYECLLVAYHVLTSEQRFDHGGARCGSAQPRILHRQPQLLVVNHLSSCLHGPEQGRVRITWRGLGVLGESLSLAGLNRVLHPDRWKGFDRLCCIVGSLPCSPGRLNLLPASRQHDSTTGGKALALDLGTERRAFELGVRVKSGEEAADDEVVQALLVRGECRRVHALRCGDDSVVVGDFLVVNVARCQADSSPGQDRVKKGQVRADASGLDMAPQFPVDAAGEMARRGARVGAEGLFVEGLSQ